MSELKKYTTTINEKARKVLQITRDEYALCAYVHYRAADTRQKVAGWCCDSKDKIAEFIDITRPGLYKMVQRMTEKGLLEVGVLGSSRVTPKWIDTEVDCKLSLQNEKGESVNKVYNERKQSLQRGVNKVYQTNNVLELELSKNKEEVDNAATPLTGPFTKVDEVEIPEAVVIPLEAGKKEKKASRGRRAATQISVEIPEPLQTPEFVEVWNKLIQTTKWRRKEASAIENSLRSLAKYEVAFSVSLVDSALSNGWQGVVFTDTPQKYERWKQFQPGHAAPATPPQPGRSTIQWAGGDMSKYDQPQVF